MLRSSHRPLDGCCLAPQIASTYVALLTDPKTKFECAALAGCHEIAVDVSMTTAKH